MLLLRRCVGYTKCWKFQIPLFHNFQILLFNILSVDRCNKEESMLFVWIKIILTNIYSKPSIIWIKWLSLQKRGFRNIVIFESRDEVGGKTTSRLYRNVWIDLGTVGLTEAYDKTVDLLERFNTGFEVRPALPSATWLNRNGKISPCIWYL